MEFENQNEEQPFDNTQIKIQYSTDGVVWRDIGDPVIAHPGQTIFHPVVPLFTRDLRVITQIPDVGIQPQISDMTIDPEFDAAAEQPKPEGSGTPIVVHVMKDIAERVAVGVERYGEPLKANNGRNALLDLYQELIDGVMYIRQELEERKSKDEQIDILENTNRTLKHINDILVSQRDEAERARNDLQASVNKLMARIGELERIPRAVKWFV